MTDGAGLLAAILANPDDDAPRLIYADVIEESDPERAEFIRVQIELSHCRDGRESCPPDSRCGRCYGCVRRERQQELWLSLRMAIWKSLPASMPPAIRSEAVNQGTISAGQDAIIRRGFVESVGCVAADWITHGDAICAAHPVTEVRLTTVPGLQGVPPSHPRAGCLSGDTHYWSLRDIADAAAIDNDETTGAVTYANSVWIRGLCKLRWPSVRTWHLPPEPLRAERWRVWTYCDITRKD